MTKINLRRRRVLLVGASATIACPTFSFAQRAKTVSILVGFPPGQATDGIARLLADKLRAATGETILVENKPGQGGGLAMAQLAKAPNDGSVMMLTHMSAVATTPFMYKNVAYDSLKDYEAVGVVGDLPFVLVCNTSLPLQNVQDLVKYAKANPEKLTNASSGNGTVSHLAMEEFKRQAGVKILHVPYKGSAAGLTDVMSGNVSVALETAAAVLPLVQAGRLRALGAATTKRLSGVLAVPTMIEQGFPDFNAATWLMFIYPAGTAKSIVRSTFEQVNKIVRERDVDQRLQSMGLLTRVSQSPEEAAAYIRSEYAKWGEVVKRAGVALD
jgi:tripartite-type tricarboxylate transporter receptor subunit TctC